MRWIFLTLIIFTLSFNSLCQTDSTHSFTIGITHNKGFIISHSPSMASLANRHISAFELYLEQNTYGKKMWHSRYSFLKIGILMKYFNLNNQDVLGNAFSVSPYLKLDLFTTKHVKFRFRPSIGLAYLGKKFNADNNFENIAIGSNFNMYLSLSVETEIKLFKRTSATLGFGLDHQSNTGFKTPNLGINMPFLTGGVSHSFGKKNGLKKNTSAAFQRKPFYWNIQTGFGINEINPPNQKKYVASSIFITREKKMNYKSSLGYGLDFYYNPAQMAILKKDSINLSPLENLQIGLSVLHILHFGKLSFTSQLSYYLKTENKELGKIYHVFGGRYALNNNMNIFFLGKTHIDKAEFILVGVGYKFNND